MKKKSIITIIVIIVIIVIAVAAKAHGKNKYPIGTPQNPYVIQWYLVGGTPADLPQVEKALDDYLVPRIGAKVELHFLGWGQYQQVMTNMIVSSSPYDLCFTASYLVNYENFASMGAFYPLTDPNNPQNGLLEKYGQGIIQNLNPAFLNGPKINGVLYAVPTNKEVADQLSYILNSTMAAKVGFDMNSVVPNAGLKTLESLEPFMAKIKAANLPAAVPYSISSSFTYELPDQVYIMSSDMPGAVEMGSTDYKVFDQWESPEYMAYMEYYHHLYQMGYIPAEAAVPNSQSNNLPKNNGINVSDFMPCQDTLSNPTNVGWQQKSFGAFTPIITTQETEGGMTAISINAQRPDIDMKFLNILNTDPYVRNLLQYGIQGVHYNLVDNQVARTPRGISSYSNWQPELGNIYLLYLNQGDPADKWAQFKAFNASANYSPIFGFHFNKTPVEDEITAVQNVEQQYGPSLFTGTADPKVVLPQFIAAMNKAGMQKILAEEQKQVNAWVAAQKAAGTLPVSKVIPQSSIM